MGGRGRYREEKINEITPVKEEKEKVQAPRGRKVHTQLGFTGSGPRTGGPTLQDPNQVPSRRVRREGARA